MKLAFVFSGQGSETLDMGKDLYINNAHYKNHINLASEIFGEDLTDIMFKENVKLKDTKYVQPILYTFHTGIRNLLNRNGVHSDGAMGLSLGEFSAYHDQDVYDFKTGLQVVIHRAYFMAEAVKETQGAMLAVIAPYKDAQILCDSISGCYIANINTPKQTVLAGTHEVVDKLIDKAPEYSIKRAIKLNTAGAFHTPLLKQAYDNFKAYLPLVKFAKPRKQIYFNETGHSAVEDIKKTMANQMVSPVQFGKQITTMINDGYDTFITISPDKSVEQLIKKIDRNVHIYTVSDETSLNQVIEAVKGND